MPINDGDLAKARAELLKLEKHANEISKDVYGKTKPRVARLKRARDKSLNSEGSIGQ
jgi:hypothetical protein